jgi:hypothetical protein
MKDTNTLIKQLADDAKPVKCQCPWTRLTYWLVGMALVVTASMVFIGIRGDVHNKMEESLFILELLSALATGLLAAIAAEWLSTPDIRQQRFVIWLPVVPLSILAFLIIYQWVIQPIHQAESEMYTLCLMDLVLIAALPAATLFFLLKKAASTSHRLMSWMALLASLAFAYFSSRLICPNDDIEHVILWHFLPMLVISSIGAAVGSVLLKWKIRR